ncbi:hypothetical protein HYPSUDRAFT_199143 [Hypholoma sublateritium FD-334 SS-4]|uniref:Uncharacterized protein n=1 Tax=Hypholoma sublateritium (strain FD-334 SS-4) TaxID=945553 RepID=A0A0D2P664_HYPSF|nr:hypothetical protein HYPSUDRAFT_199143 [Hypholoma sublateritium FD-334 SS-4]
MHISSHSKNEDSSDEAKEALRVKLGNIKMADFLREISSTEKIAKFTAMQAEDPSATQYVAEKAIPHVKVLFQGVLQNMAPEPTPTAPRLTICLNGHFQAIIPWTVTPRTAQRESDAADELDDKHLEAEDEDLLGEVDRLLERNSQDSEDGPDWMFAKDETVSKDPEYIFCPAPHRQQILHLFTKHFC